MLQPVRTYFDLQNNHFSSYSSNLQLLEPREALFLKDALPTRDAPEQLLEHILHKPLCTRLAACIQNALLSKMARHGFAWLLVSKDTVIRTLFPTSRCSPQVPEVMMQQDYGPETSALGEVSKVGAFAAPFVGVVDEGPERGV